MKFNLKDRLQTINDRFTEKKTQVQHRMSNHNKTVNEKKNDFENYDPYELPDTDLDDRKTTTYTVKEILIRLAFVLPLAYCVCGWFGSAMENAIINFGRQRRHLAPYTIKYTFFHNFIQGLVRFGSGAFWLDWILVIGIAGGVYYFVYINDRQKKMINDNRRLNYRKGDMRLQRPEEFVETYDIFPDAGLHSHTVVPTMILAHMMISEKTAPKIPRITYEPDYEIDENGEYKVTRRGGLIQKVDEHGNPQYIENVEQVKSIDNDFSERLFESADIYKNSGHQKYYNAKELNYNPHHRRGRTNEDKVAGKIANDWFMPDYEEQIAGGFYVVTTDPSNTFVVAKTRAGKGQTEIEPLIDCWSRMEQKQNFIVNDPKEELLCKFYYPLVKRGYSVIQFNLLFSERTNIYNPLLYAADSARRGDIVATQTYIKNISQILFPEQKGGDKFWVDAPRLVFEELAFGLIAVYQQEEREMRQKAHEEGWSDSDLNYKLDQLWGQVTLYNIYQMMNQLASKNTSDPDLLDVGDDDVPDQIDELSLFFKAMKQLPQNSIRQAAIDRNSSLKQMANSDKTIASVYGIATSKLAFFADDTIARLTSGRPSQNFDMASLSFPRRINIQFSTEWLEQENLKGCMYEMHCFRDSEFTDQYEGNDFSHQGVISPDGWCNNYFKGIFDGMVAYLQLDLKSRTGEHLLIHRMYFKFIKHYQHDLDGQSYIIEPVTGERIINGGTIIPMNTNVNTYDETQKYRFGHKPKVDSKFNKEGYVYPSHQIDVNPSSTKTKIIVTKSIISQTDIGYEEKPKAIFLVTPPNKLAYAQIILILVSQTFETQTELAYGGKSDQHPLYNTYYLFDEVGNLKFDGAGIPELQTKESIGLGQGQYFILILQSLQQLRDVYGDSVDKILESNTANIVYLSSPDITMLEHLSKLSGIQHRAYNTGRTVHINDAHQHRVLAGVKPDVELSAHSEAEPVISVSQMLNIPKANSITFGRGNPIWATNQTALPYAYALHAKRLCEPGMEDTQNRAYSAAMVPSISHTDEFSKIGNIPDFFEMVRKLVKYAQNSHQIIALYQQRAGLTEEEMLRKRTDAMADNIMDGIVNQIKSVKQMEKEQQQTETSTFVKLVSQRTQNAKLTDEETTLQYLPNDGETSRFTNYEFFSNREDNEEFELDQAFKRQSLINDKKIEHVSGSLSDNYKEQMRKYETQNKAYTDSLNKHMQIEGESNRIFVKLDNGTEFAANAFGVQQIEDAIDGMSYDSKKPYATLDDFQKQLTENGVHTEIKDHKLVLVNDFDDHFGKVKAGLVLIIDETDDNDQLSSLNIQDGLVQLLKTRKELKAWNEFGTDLITGLAESNE